MCRLERVESIQHSLCCRVVIVVCSHFDGVHVVSCGLIDVIMDDIMGMVTGQIKSLYLGCACIKDSTCPCSSSRSAIACRYCSCTGCVRIQIVIAMTEKRSISCVNRSRKYSLVSKYEIIACCSASYRSSSL